MRGWGEQSWVQASSHGLPWRDQRTADAVYGVRGWEKGIPECFVHKPHLLGAHVPRVRDSPSDGAQLFLLKPKKVTRTRGETMIWEPCNLGSNPNLATSQQSDHGPVPSCSRLGPPLWGGHGVAVPSWGPEEADPQGPFQQGIRQTVDAQTCSHIWSPAWDSGRGGFSASSFSQTPVQASFPAPRNENYVEAQTFPLQTETEK